MSTPLATRKCTVCDGNTPPLNGSQLTEYLGQIAPHWSPGPDNKSISAEFTFENYYQTTAFVNAVAWIAHREDHHPDISFGWNRCTVLFETHAAGGLTENDFICAAKVNALLD